MEAPCSSSRRHINESIRIAEDVTVTVLDIKGTQARIGISAPKSVAVHREEIYVRMKEGESSDGGQVQ